LIRELLREAYEECVSNGRNGAGEDVDFHPLGSTTAKCTRVIPPNFIKIELPEADELPIRTEVEGVWYRLTQYDYFENTVIYTQDDLI